ncbi:lactonase family protein [Devosia nitrariae]|uniref:6-phosphogluconolactonase n=1 Tax=Devosia nitrariae TaxID=2071872 RepID=A0ABQ5W5U8_9HYPH|nr:lactonase family protein [Devosia nitrariae]GLQ55248.1 6-phosphogluconolactonase [Devosia nitrariae]
MSSSLVHVFVGQVNRKADTVVSGQGLTVLTFDEDTLEFSSVCMADDIDNPTFLDVDVANSTVYAVSEVVSWLEGTVSAYAFNERAGTLTYLNKQPTLGRTTCHVTVTGDGHLAVANYSQGTGGPDQAVAIYSIGADGHIGAPLASTAHFSTVGPRADRQERSHAHSVQQTPDGHYFLVADLGTDELVAYRLQDGGLIRAFAYAATPGAGPRHFTFHPDGKLVYVVNEIAATVSALSYAGESLSLIEELSMLPEGVTEQTWAADIHLSPDGRFLYASNRVFDSIATFAVEPDGRLRFLGTTPSEGSWPRSFAITPSGRHLLVANHNSDSIVVLARDGESGSLTQTGKALSINAPFRVQAVAFT